MSVKEQLVQAATNVKVGAATAATTTTTGAATFFDLVPDDIGKLASCFGIVLTSILIVTHLRKGRLDYEKTKLEIAIMQERERERKEITRARLIVGDPVRRAGDKADL